MLINCVKMSHLWPFGRLPTLGSYREDPNIKMILIKNEDLMTGSNVFQYSFGICLCTIVAKF